MISTTAQPPPDTIPAEEKPAAAAANWWEPQPRGRTRVDRREAEPIPIPEMDTPRPAQLDLGLPGAHLPLHMRSYSPAPPTTSALSDGPASPAALFLSAFSSPAPSVRSPSPLPAVISPAMAMFHSPPPLAAATATAVSPVSLSALPDAGASVGGYVLGPVIGHGGFSTIRTATSEVTGGVVAVKIVPIKSSLPSADAPRGRGGARAATIGRAATIAGRGRPPLPSFPQPEPEDDTSRSMAEEAALWSSLSHEHILPLFSAEETLGAWFLFTLYCPAGTLLDLLKRDGQILSTQPPSAGNTPAKRRPSFASSFASARGRSSSITQSVQRGGLLPETAATLFRQVVRGLRYLHETARVVHCDIKLENVLVDENGGARIADFGLAVPMDADPRVESSVERSVERRSIERGTIAERRSVERKAVSIGLGPAPGSGIGRANSVSVASPSHVSQKHKFPPGSLPYASPELLRLAAAPQARGRMTSKSRERGRARQEEGHVPNPAQDIWALGCVLHALFTGRLPFTDAFEPRLQMKITRGIWDESMITALPNSFALLDVLRGCLLVSVPQRWTAAEVDERAWAIGVVDEEAEREAAKVERRGRAGAMSGNGDGDVFRMDMKREQSRGRRGASQVRGRDPSVARDGSIARERGASVVRGRRMESVGSSSYSPSPSARGRSVSAGPKDLSIRRGPSMSRTRSSPAQTSIQEPHSVTATPKVTRAPSLTRSLIPRYSATLAPSGPNTPPTAIDSPVKRPSLQTTRSFNSATSLSSPSASSSSGAPPLSPEDHVGSLGSSRSRSADRQPDQSPVLKGSGSLNDRLGIDVERLGRTLPRSPSEGPRTPDEPVARSRSRGRFTAELAIVDEGESAPSSWGLDVNGYEQVKAPVMGL
ncbi:kinase domain protein [Ceratobasidium sp. AG-Ba]|nr:kinase domain protein [Ceratobasidium sp. AG-Ba]